MNDDVVNRSQFPGLPSPGLIEARLRRPVLRLTTGPFPGLPSPGLIEAAYQTEPLRCHLSGFRGFPAPASLKPCQVQRGVRIAALFPGLPSPGLIEASPIAPCLPLRIGFPGLPSPGLIEAHFKTLSPTTCPTSFRGFPAPASLKLFIDLTGISPAIDVSGAAQPRPH